jgi:hypothetical protein
VYQRKLFHVSVGRGRGAQAKKLLDKFTQQGRWVVLENCHLAGVWMRDLQHIVESLPDAEPHPEFRLWLTMAPSPDFPLPVLRVGVKMMDTSPRSIKAKMMVRAQHSGNIQGTFRQHSGNIWATFREHSNVIHGPLRRLRVGSVYESSRAYK